MASKLLQERLQQAGLSIQDIRGQVQPSTQTQGFSLGQTVRNIPSSATRLVKDIGTAVFNPIDTTRSLVDVAVGGISKLIPGEQPQEESFDAVVDFFKQRFGGVENIKQTIQNDPVGFLGDLSLALTGTGAAIRGAGAVGKVSKISQAGKAVQRVGLAAEPITLAGKAVSKATKFPRAAAGGLVRESLGVTTGTGGEVIKQAFRNPTKEFTQALRGRVSTDDVLTVAREGLQTLKDQRAATYTKQLAKVKNATEAITTQAELTSFIDTQLTKFNIKRSGDGLDFSKSAIADTGEQTRIGEVIQAATTWDDFTPTGLDILKQRLDDFYTTSGKGRSLTNAIRGHVAGTLRTKVSGYAAMTKEYAESSTLIKEIERTLSLKQGASVDTTIKKLMSAIKGNNEFRLDLVNKLDEITKRDITSQLAGTALSPGVPSGLIGRGLFAGSLTGATGLAGLTSINPVLLFGIAFASPRVVGELLRVLGMGQKAIDSVVSFIGSDIGREALQAAFQSGRLENSPTQEQ